MDIFLPHSTRNASNGNTKTYVPLKAILETEGGGATGRSQGFMTTSSPRRTVLF